MSTLEITIDSAGALVQQALAILLMPLFLDIANGDVTLAHAAARELITGSDGRSPMEWLFTALAFAFGSESLAALAQPIPEEASQSMKLRVRANANALSRSSERCWNALQISLQAPLPQAYDPAENARLIEHTARVAQAVKSGNTAAPSTPQPVASAPAPASAEKQSPSRTMTAPPPPAPPAIVWPTPAAPATAVTSATWAPATSAAPATSGAPTTSGPATSGARPRTYRSAFADAMVDVAQEIAETLPGLPPDQLRAAKIQIEALTSSAQTLNSNEPLDEYLPPGMHPFPRR
jgi:hypothetical protein